MEENYFGTETKRLTTGFVLALVAMLLFTLMGVGVDVDQYLQHEDLNIPGWYFGLIFSVDALLVVAILLIFLYRKVGVLMYPVLVLAHFLLHLYYLDTFLYTDVMNLFVYFGAGLLVVIPRWNFFK